MFGTNDLKTLAIPPLQIAPVWVLVFLSPNDLIYLTFKTLEALRWHISSTEA